MGALDQTKTKAKIYDLKRQQQGITGNLELLIATRNDGYQLVTNGTISSGWHPKQRSKFGETILEMRIAELASTIPVAVKAASHLRYTSRGQVLIFKFSAGDRPRKATAVWKLQLKPTGEAS